MFLPVNGIEIELLVRGRNRSLRSRDEKLI